MHKRRVLFLGVIGSILGSVIGVMTSDDAEEYNEAINDIYEKQNNISKIIGKQTHTIKAEVNNIYQDLKKKTKQIQRELNERMEDYEFPIPTSHIRAELLAQIDKTGIKIASGKLLISVDIPLLDRKALQLYKIYPFPMYQNISENHTRAIYISPKKQCIAPTGTQININSEEFIYNP